MEKSKRIRTKPWDVADKILAGSTMIIMAVMSILVVLAVILRYVFNQGFVWSEELIILLFICTTYFGSILV